MDRLDRHLRVGQIAKVDTLVDLVVLMVPVDLMERVGIPSKLIQQVRAPRGGLVVVGLGRIMEVEVEVVIVEVVEVLVPVEQLGTLMETVVVEVVLTIVVLISLLGGYTQGRVMSLSH
jgi:hypothetical protein